MAEGAEPGPRSPSSPSDDTPAALPLCPSAELAEKGLAFSFAVLQWRQPARAFVLRHDAEVVGYLNRCLHVPMEMDWQPGEFLDSSKKYILCSTHGAAYEPRTGRCVAGPCGRGALIRLAVEERDGTVYWIPSRDTRPVPEARIPEPGTST